MTKGIGSLFLRKDTGDLYRETAKGWVVTGATGPAGAPGLSGGVVPPGEILIAGVSVIDAVDDAGNAVKRVAVTVVTPLSGTIPDGVHIWDDEPDSSGSIGDPTDGSVAADGTKSAVGAFDPLYIGWFSWAGSTSQVYTFDAAIPTVAQYNRVYVSAGSKTFTPAPVQHLLVGETPSFQYLSAPRITASGTEYAPNVSSLAFATDLPEGWTSNPNITLADSGDQFWQKIVTFVWPTSDPLFSQLAGINGMLEFKGQRHYLGNLSVTRSPLWENIAPQPVFNGTTAYTLYLISYDQNGNSNSLVPGVTPSISFVISRQTGAPGSERTKLPSGVTWSVGTFIAGDGTNEIDVTVNGVDPTDPAFGGYALFYMRPQDSVPVEVRPPSRGRILPLEWVGSNPATVQTWTFYLVAIDTNNHVNNIVAGVTPSITISVGSGSGLLDISKAAPGTFSGAHFDNSFGMFKVRAGGINSTEITDGAITTPKLTASQIDVGGGGSKPIRFRVFDALNALIGWIGDDTGNSGFVGGWLKQLRVGGTSPSTAKLVADVNGNVTMTGAITASAISGSTISAGTISGTSISAGSISGAAITGSTLTLNNNGATCTVANNTENGVLSGPAVKMADNASLARTLMQPKSFIAQFDTTLKHAAYLASGDGAFLPAICTLYDQNGSTVIQMVGQTGASLPYVYIGSSQVITIRQAGPGNTTDTTDVAIRLNNLLAALRTHGLIT